MLFSEPSLSRPMQLQTCMLRASELIHPRILVLYYAGLLVLVLTAFHPVLSLMLFFCCLILSVLVRGYRKTLRSCMWQLPLIGIIALANPLFSASGSTELFHIGGMAIYAESLWYGLSSAAVFIACLLVFSCMNELVSAQKFISLFPQSWAKLGFIAALALHLVPSLFKRGELLLRIDRINCPSAYGEGNSAKGMVERYLSRARQFVRSLGILIGLSLEESLERARFLRIRGFSESRLASNAHSTAQKPLDSYLLAVVLLHCCAALFLLLVLGGQSSFYPRLTVGNTLLCSASALMLVSYAAYPWILVQYWKSLWKERL